MFIDPLRLCSLAFTGRQHQFQGWYFCRTCFRNMARGVCITCAQICHQGHDLVFGNESRFYCDCNERHGISCKCLRPRKPIVPGQLSLERARGVVEPTTESRVELIEIKNEDREERVDNYKEGDTCIVCMDAPKEALFFPCGHVVSCMECACLVKQRNDPCIICREKIDEVVRTFRV